MKKYSYYIVALAVVFMIGFYLTLKSEQEKNPLRTAEIPEASVKTGPDAKKNNNTAAARQCSQPNPIFTGVKAPKFDEAAVDKYLSEAAFNLTSVIETAAHDPIANIALFRLASSCFTNGVKQQYPGIENGCPARLNKLPVRTIALELLQKASDQGSADAKLMYALNAPITADRLRKAGTEEGRLLAQEIMKRAQDLGEGAARAGVPDAFRYMSRAYESGLLGSKDIQLAYAYALPLRLIGSDEDFAYIKTIESRLNVDMKKTAETVAFGCNGSREDLNTIKPF